MSTSSGPRSARRLHSRSRSSRSPARAHSHCRSPAGRCCNGCLRGRTRRCTGRRRKRTREAPRWSIHCSSRRSLAIQLNSVSSRACTHPCRPLLRKRKCRASQRSTSRSHRKPRAPAPSTAPIRARTRLSTRRRCSRMGRRPAAVFIPRSRRSSRAPRRSIAARRACTPPRARGAPASLCGARPWDASRALDRPRTAHALLAEVGAFLNEPPFPPGTLKQRSPRRRRSPITPPPAQLQSPVTGASGSGSWLAPPPFSDSSGGIGPEGSPNRDRHRTRRRRTGRRRTRCCPPGGRRLRRIVVPLRRAISLVPLGRGEGLRGAPASAAR
jgi:hypothetical protein